MSGGFGVGPIKNIVSYLDTSEADFQGIVVCGYNKKLKIEIGKVNQTAKHKFKVFGFVDNVDELMRASDLLVSKSGGISVTEALNAGLPLVVVRPIPGQEMRNYRFLEKNDAALRIKNPREVVKMMGLLMKSGKADTLKRNVEKIRLLNSAERIRDEADK